MAFNSSKLAPAQKALSPLDFKIITRTLSSSPAPRMASEILFSIFFGRLLEAGWKNIWESLEPIIADQGSPRNSFIKLLIKIAEIAQARPGLFEFLFNAPKTIKLESQPWKEYQHRLYGVIQGLLEDGVREGEFPKINPELMFKALGGLFMGLVFMGDKKDPVSEKDVEKLLNQLITDPNYSSN